MLVAVIGFAAVGFVIGMFAAEPVARRTNDTVGVVVVLVFALAFGASFWGFVEALT